jgi:peroxiredoxin
MHLPSNSLDNYTQKNMHNNYTSTVDIVLYFFKMAFTKKEIQPHWVCQWEINHPNSPCSCDIPKKSCHIQRNGLALAA